MAKKNKKEVTGLNAQITKELDKAIDDLNLFDDDLMSKVFDVKRRIVGGGSGRLISAGWHMILTVRRQMISITNPWPKA